MRKMLVAVMLFALSLPGVASALTYTPTLNELKTWGNLGGGSSTQNTLQTPEDLRPYMDAVKFTGNLYGSGPSSSLPNQGYEWIGLNLSSDLNLTGYDSFGLTIYNNNENPWNYALFLADNNYNMAVSSPFFMSIVNGSSASLKIDLADAGIDLAHIQTIGFIVECDNLPMLIYNRDGTVRGVDRTFETAVAPVPEPGTMMLLGAGFLGLAVYGKRRKNA